MPSMAHLFSTHLFIIFSGLNFSSREIEMYNYIEMAATTTTTNGYQNVKYRTFKRGSRGDLIVFRAQIEWDGLKRF